MTEKSERRIKILIVDDEKNMRRLLEYNLEKAGYEVYSATDGEKAFVKAKETEPDLILSDIMMPHLNGLELFKRLRSDNKTRFIPVIFVSAEAQAADKQKGLSLGAYSYITKPINVPHLLNTIQTLFEK